MVDIHDVITQANFGDDRLRGLGVAVGQILAFPIDFDRRPYNTLASLALPCECVMICVAWWLKDRSLDLRFTGRGFNSRPVRFHVT